ncbi:hypothetical protein H5410_057410 [Solanum commersonii]|uniref:Uncharacterized protein n=1 Tax=Solanum commersonii TaxID=4109 RepID=A0A9J5WQ34_SOLCO|nr:hypothetical protein H5410_057410 [Solanum commersonii]
MLEWKNWHILGSVEFPKLGKLSIKYYRKLMGKLPENLSSLTKLRISTYPLVILETPIQLSSLKRFEVIDSPKVEVLFDDVELFLEYLILQKCDSISPELVPRARYLGVESCPNLTIGMWGEPDNIFGNTKLFEAEVAARTTCNSTQIQSLLEQGWLSSSLSELHLHHHHELHSLGLRNLTSLLGLHINNCPNLKSLSESALPSSLSVLTIHDCPKFQSLPVKEIPSSLSVLNIRNCHNFQSLLHLHVSDCPNLQSLSESALPSSLSKLTVGNCHNLQSLSESALPSSLSELTLLDCPNLQSLPVKGMPSSLSKLSIFRCPLLKPLLEFDKGEYWPNIAQIPIIYIDRDYL